MLLKMTIKRKSDGGYIGLTIPKTIEENYTQCRKSSPFWTISKVLLIFAFWTLNWIYPKYQYHPILYPIKAILYSLFLFILLSKTILYMRYVNSCTGIKLCTVTICYAEQIVKSLNWFSVYYQILYSLWHTNMIFKE